VQNSRGTGVDGENMPTNPDSTVVRLDDFGQANSNHGPTLVTALGAGE